MNVQKKYLINPWILSVPAAAGLIGILLGSFFDLKIDQVLYDPNAGWAKFLGAYGPLPCFWFINLAGWIWIDKCRHLDAAKRILYFILSLIAFSIGVIYITQSAVKYLNLPISVSILISLAVNLLPSWLIYHKIPDPQKAGRLVIMILGVCAGSFILVQLLKHIWLRPRFIALQADPELSFQPWWHVNHSLIKSFPALYAQNPDFFYSFPSGHSASAACLIILCALPVYTHSRNQYLLFTLSLIFAFLVCFSRMVLGYHFLSDVSAGFLITYLLFVFCYWKLFASQKRTAAEKTSD